MHINHLFQYKYQIITIIIHSNNYLFSLILAYMSDNEAEKTEIIADENTEQTIPVTKKKTNYYSRAEGKALKKIRKGARS